MSPLGKGSCVNFTSDAGVKADAGPNDAGAATATNCNPINNAGCTGTDVCSIDQSGMFYVCSNVSTMPDVACGGDCTAATAYCAAGGLCVGVSATSALCIQMCCTDADCSTGPCVKTGFLTTDLPSGVGLCVQLSAP